MGLMGVGRGEVPHNLYHPVGTLSFLAIGLALQIRILWTILKKKS